MSEETYYKGWLIEELNEQGYYEAYDLNDCDAPMIYAKSLEVLKIEIDETQDDK